MVTAVAVLALGAAVLWRARGSRLSVLFFTITVVAAGWLAALSGVYESNESSLALHWARLAAFFSCLIPVAIFHFSVVYSGRGLRGALFLAWAYSILIGLLGATTGLFIKGLWHYAWGVYPRGSLLNLIWISPMAAMVAASIVLIWRAGAGKEASEKVRGRAIIAAFVIGSLALIDYFPILGIGVPPAGFMAVLAFIVLAAVAIWRYRLVELTPAYAAEQILTTMKGAVVVADLDGRIRVVNAAARSLLGYEQRELLGQSIRMIIDPEESISSGQLLRSLGMLELPMGWRTARGNRIDMNVSSSFIRHADGTPVGVVYVATDVTERRKAEQALRESEHRYRTLFEGNPLPMWVYDFETLRFIAVNEAAVKHYGYSRDEFLQMTIADIRPPEDIPRMQETLAHLRDRDRNRVFRHRKKGGAVFDAEITSFEFVSGGRRARLVIALDVTERRQAMDRLRESEERYRLLFERNLAGVFRTTLQGRFLEINDALARMFGYEREELMAKTAHVLYFSDEERSRLMSRLQEQKSVSNVELRLRRRDGTPIWVLENINFVEVPEGGLLEGTLIDITDRKSAQEQVEYQAYHDVLTGLPNRLLFRDRISVALAHARRIRRAVAVMFLDLDQFKLVNDTLGHTVGDGLLEAAAERLVDCVRA